MTESREERFAWDKQLWGDILNQNSVLVIKSNYLILGMFSSAQCSQLREFFFFKKHIFDVIRTSHICHSHISFLTETNGCLRWTENWRMDWLIGRSMFKRTWDTRHYLLQEIWMKKCKTEKKSVKRVTHLMQDFLNTCREFWMEKTDIVPLRRS